MAADRAQLAASEREKARILHTARTGCIPRTWQLHRVVAAPL